MLKSLYFILQYEWKRCFCITQIFRADQGDRQNVPNYLIIITDGNSNIRREETLTQAIAARIEGIHIVTVAIGK